MSQQHEQLVDLLREVHRDLGKHFKAVLDIYDLTPPVLLICKQMEIQPGITVSEAARCTGIAKSHVSNTISELERRGWVVKRPDERDQRLSRLYLNDLGREKLFQARAQIRSRLNELVAGIPEDEAAVLVNGLADLRTALQRSRDVEP